MRKILIIYNKNNNNIDINTNYVFSLYYSLFYRSSFNVFSCLFPPYLCFQSLHLTLAPLIFAWNATFGRDKQHLRHGIPSMQLSFRQSSCHTNTPTPCMPFSAGITKLLPCFCVCLVMGVWQVCQCVYVCVCQTQVPDIHNWMLEKGRSGRMAGRLAARLAGSSGGLADRQQQ